jgi:hypothetical protein
MTKYRATIVSPLGAAPASSSIEFESEHKAGSKQNIQDARYKMLELHGSEAVSWTVTNIERVPEAEQGAIQEQLMLDFREPAEKPKRKRRSVKRGIS